MVICQPDENLLIIEMILYETHMFYKHKHRSNKMPNMWVPSYH